MPATRTILPGDPRYPTLVRGFNQRWVGQPRYVVVAESVRQVQAAVQRSVNEGLRLTVRSGGHCYEGWSSRTEGMILDVSPMNRAGWDRGRSSWYIEGGCTNWDIQNALYRRYGVTLPGGSCYSVGAGGHICGGGYGLLSRRHGLTVDWLSGIQGVFVGADGRARVVTAMADAQDPAERDLFWAHTGGGGGNFGVVTRYLFRDLPPAPKEAWLASLSWEWSELLDNRDELVALVRNYGQFFEQHGASGDGFDGLFALLHLTCSAAEQVTLTVQSLDADREPLDYFLAALRRDIKTVRTVAPRVPVGRDHFVGRCADGRRMPWLEVTQTLNGSGANQRGKYKSAYMKQPFPERQLEAIWRWLTSGTNPQALLQVDSYGGRVNAVAADATAVPQRSSILKLQYQTYWTAPEDDATNLSWIRDFYQDMYGEGGPVPDSVMDGCYVNYPDADLKNWAELYYKEAYPRLQRAKARWDPGNRFNHAQSIALP